MESSELSRETKRCLKGVLTYLWIVQQSKYSRPACGLVFRAFASGDNFKKMALKPLENLISTHAIEGKSNKNQVTKIIGYLKSLIQETHTVFHEKLLENEIGQKVINPLIKMTGWSLKDENEAKNLLGLLAEESGEKTLDESSSKLWNAVKIGGAVAAGAGIIFEIHNYLKKNKTGEQK